MSNNLMNKLHALFESEEPLTTEIDMSWVGNVVDRLSGYPSVEEIEKDQFLKALKMFYIKTFPVAQEYGNEDTSWIDDTMDFLNYGVNSDSINNDDFLKGVKEIYDIHFKVEEDETQAGNDIDEIAAIVYSESSNDVNEIPSFEETNDYIASVTKSEYLKIYKNVKQATQNVEDHFYNGMIELSDRATMNELTNADRNIDEWAQIVTKKLEQFEEETKVGVWQDGRMGRHIVVEDNYYNARDYNKLCATLERLEQEAIDEFNGEDINESSDINAAADAINTFNDSPKTLEDYNKFLSILSQLEWNNKISRSEYEEYLAHAQKILASRSIVKESIDSEEEFNDTVARVAEYNKYLNNHLDDTEVLDKTLKLIKQIDDYMAIHDPNAFIVPYDIPAPVLNNQLNNRCPYCANKVSKEEMKVLGMCKDCYDNGVE